MAAKAAKERVLEACRGDVEQARACWAAAGIDPEAVIVLDDELAAAIAGRPFFPDEP